MNQIIKERISQIQNGIVPEGYKKTDFGIFPQDWEQKTFGEIFDFFGSLSKSRDELGDKGIPYLHYGDMHRSDFKIASYSKYLHLPKYDMQLKGTEAYLLNDGDVVFLDASEDITGTTRSVVVDNPENKPFLAGLHTFVGKEKDDVFDKYYKQYLTLPEYVRKQMMRLAIGFKVYGVNRNEMGKVNCFVPSKPEQKRIADILEKWDKTIELQEQLIEKLKTKKAALLQALFVPTRIWDYKMLGDVCQISTGKLDANASDKIGKYPFFTCAKEILKINQFAFDCEALLIAGNGDIGDIKYYNGKFNAYQRTYVLFDFKVPIKYVYYYLQKNFDREVLLGTQKSSMPYIKLETLKKTKIKYNNNTLKKVALLEKIDELISLAEEKQIVLLEQQKSMQQLLLTGIVRV